MAEVKDQLTLARAFVHLRDSDPDLRGRLRLTMVGEGPLRTKCVELLAAAGALEACDLPGLQNDIPEVLQRFDVFVLPSIAEGTSNTILEAMASELPVIATSVGGNGELVVPDVTGMLVPPGDHLALAAAIRGYVNQPWLGVEHGAAGRRRVTTHFGLQRMVDAYHDVYAALC
jgi:glycosyltransferase involved in cell wall biosynthesis